jgi:hypothetical protein
MPPLITNLSATTELEAVNAMLAAVGEQPLPSGTDLSTSTQADVAMALNILRNVTREVQSMGWKFNTEFGFEIVPTGTSPVAWTDTAGIVTQLNIFKPPAGMIAFSVTPIPAQQGSRSVDTEIRPSRKYVEAAKPVLVFYDRQHARDGFVALDHAFLYINPVWLLDFEQMPESARKYVTARAAREFVQGSVGSATLSAFAQNSESLALRTLKREQGEEDSYNWLGNVDAQLARGGRGRGPTGMFDQRTNRGSV